MGGCQGTNQANTNLNTLALKTQYIPKEGEKKRVLCKLGWFGLRGAQKEKGKRSIGRRKK